MHELGLCRGLRVGGDTGGECPESGFGLRWVGVPVFHVGEDLFHLGGESHVLQAERHYVDQIPPLFG